MAKKTWRLDEGFSADVQIDLQICGLHWSVRGRRNLSLTNHETLRFLIIAFSSSSGQIMLIFSYKFKVYDIKHKLILFFRYGELFKIPFQKIRKNSGRQIARAILKNFFLKLRSKLNFFTNLN